MINKKIKIGMFILVGVLLISLVSASYSRSNPNYGKFDSFVVSEGGIDRDTCEAGQDFVIQIAPFGCTPAVVRSDLLEEQNVPVFCQLGATKINPLIDVEAIESMSFSGEYPPEVSGVGFHPARAALGVQGDLNSPILNNIGYAVIVLKKQPKESEMPDFVEGNLTARIKYDIKNAFGIGEANFYLPELSDNDWEKRKAQYSFWDGRGYLRAENIDENGATITISDDIRKITSVNLEKGETSRKIYIPGFDCLAGLELKLHDLENPDTRAKLDINGGIVEVKEGERFLENKCRIIDLDKKGIVELIEIRCDTDDERREKIELSVSPRVKLNFTGAKEEGYEVGEKLFLSENENKNVYLGYIGFKGDSGDENDLYVRFVEAPRAKYDHEMLSGEMISEVARYDKGGFGAKTSFIRKIGIFFEEASADLVERFAKFLVKGTRISGILKFSETKEIYGTDVILIGFSGAVDSELKGDLEKNYDNALKDFDKVIDNYPNEKCGDITCGEKALSGKISATWDARQKRTVLEFCEEFKINYPNSKKNLVRECEDNAKLSSSEVSMRDVVINKNVKRISFEGIYEPSKEEYSVDITIRNAEEGCDGGVLGKKDTACFSDYEFIQLKELHEDYAIFDVNSVEESTAREVAWKTSNLRIDLDDFKVIGENNYQIRVNEINLKKSAKVSVIPNIDNVGTEASFKFKVGIEKRAIKLSPEKTKERIDNLDKTIEDWEDKSKTLGNVVKGFKGACLATGAGLTIKNFFANTGGKGIARQSVMRGAGGWNDKCTDVVGGSGELANEGYKTINECLTKESKNIDKDVNAYANALSQQNDEIKGLQSGCEQESSGGIGELLGGGTPINTDCFKKKYCLEVETQLTKSIGGRDVDVGDKNVKASKILEGSCSQSVSVEQLRELQLNSRVDSSMAETQLNRTLKDIYANTEQDVEINDFAKSLGIEAKDANFVLRKDAKELVYKEKTYRDIKDKVTISNVTDNTPIATLLTSDGKKYIAVLEKSGSKYSFKENGLYEFNGTPVEDDDLTQSIYFKKYDSSSYQNPFKSVSGETGVVVKFYETEPYKGLPGLVPFDLEEGWYAATKQTLPLFGGIKAFDESGRVTSVWVCNVGENGIAEFKSGIGDDICEMVNLGTGQPYNSFPGLSESDGAKIVKCAVDAISDASNHKSGNMVRISTSCGGSQSIKVGKPSVDIPEMQCQDFMSPKDCQLLFNVCDPVICPSSRCNLGGAYPVKDVIQSGIIGSIALCLPNIREGIYVPVCLTGIKAGIDGYLSVVQSHRDCLQESLDSGEMVGICDEIYSIHLCEFFWRQGLPIAKMVLPKLVEVAMGQGTKGGGEYLGVASAWANADDSITYFTQYYAANSFKAFKARSAEDVGGEVCRSFNSGVYPEGGNILDNLLEPDSPSQFHGRFDEVLFTSATVPPVSHYKVYFHIYAGKDRSAYYQVYLKAGPESSFYQDTSYRRNVDSGYIAKGGYASETIDFTAPSGYKEMCIRVNDQEECGFKQVSTSYGINYVNDKFMEEQISEKNIKSETECIGGSASLYSLATPSLQGGAEEIVNPSIYERGIIRICSTENPGKGTDDSRWAQVGYCGDQKIKCWLDRESAENVIKDFDIENKTLKELEENSLKILEAEGKYEKKESIEGKIKEKEDLMQAKEYQKVIDLVDKYLGKTFWNNQKAILLLNRGEAYSKLARGDTIEVEQKKSASKPNKCYDDCFEKKKCYEGGGPTCADECVEECSGDIGTTDGNGDDDGDEGGEEGKASGEENSECISQTCGSSSAAGQAVMGGDSCKKDVGKELMLIAKSSKTDDDKFKDEVIQADVGVENFECLVLMVARQEGCLAHCKYNEEESNPLYCDSGEENIITGDNGDSIGIMQITISNHGEHYSFKDNVEYAANFLSSRYNKGLKHYECGGENYGGWKRALRYYNGWNTDCNKGDKDYVENVLSKKGEIERLFPECKIGGEEKSGAITDPDQSGVEEEGTNGYSTDPNQDWV